MTRERPLYVTVADSLAYAAARHPSNLQCLCDSCNARKSVREDRRQ